MSQELIKSIRESEYIGEAKKLLKSEKFKCCEKFNEVAIEILKKIKEDPDYIYDEDKITEELLKFFIFENVKIDSSQIFSLIPGKFEAYIPEDFKDFYEDVESDYEKINEIFDKIKLMCQSKPILNIPNHPFEDGDDMWFFEILRD